MRRAWHLLLCVVDLLVLAVIVVAALVLARAAVFRG